MAGRVVLVAGASGGTGMRIVRALAAHDFTVRALIRDPAKSAELAAAGAAVLVAPLSDIGALGRAAAGTLAVISALGSRTLTDQAAIEAVEFDGITALADAASSAGAAQFVLISSMGTETPHLLPPLAAVLRVKRRAEQYLEAGTLPYTIIRPGGLTDEPGGGGVVAARSLGRHGRISRDDVAVVAVQALLQAAARNRIVEILNDPSAPPAARPDFFADL